MPRLLSVRPTPRKVFHYCDCPPSRSTTRRKSACKQLRTGSRGPRIPQKLCFGSIRQPVESSSACAALRARNLFLALQTSGLAVLVQIGRKVVQGGNCGTKVHQQIHPKSLDV